jgi:type I restriction enzyme S subunit
MIGGLKPYAEYKDSGLVWAREIPNGWDLLRGKSVFGLVDARSKTGMEELLTVSSNHGVIPRRQTSVTMFKAKSYIGHKLCWPGDLVVNSLWAWMQGLGVAQHHGLISSAYSVYRPRQEYSEYGRFFHYLLRSDAYKWELQTRSKGVWISRLQLSDIAFMDMSVLLPPPDEQAAIVRFLDHANRKIDRFIRAKRKLIALLNEQKQAIIYRAVTRGLNPDVKLKPCGINWLGDIPEHWGTPLLGRFLTRIEQGWSPVAAEGELEESQWCVLTLSSVRRGVFNPTASKPVSQTATIPRDITVADGDFLLTRSNTRDRVGDVCIAQDVRPKTLLCDLIYRLSLRRGGFVPQFLVYQLLCPFGRGQIEVDARGSSGTMPKISQSHIKAWRVLMPPTEEQQDIVQFIDNETTPINTAIARTEREIALMQEYRTRLTADVVTGKLDVREAAAKLPEIEESTELSADADILDEELFEEAESEETDE